MTDKPITLSPTNKIRQPGKSKPAALGDGNPDAVPPAGLHSGPELMNAGLKVATGQLDKIQAASKQLNAIRGELGELAQMGEMVTDEDVVEAAGRLVADGLEAHTIAGLLSSMPQGGQALADWIGQQVMMAEQKAQELDAIHDQARHSVGVAALRALGAHHLSPPEATPGSEGNALTLNSPVVGNA